MTPDDPRHGTPAGYVRGCRCEDCTAGIRRYEKQRIHDRNHGQPRRVPRIGTARRLHALVALGWDYRHIGDRLGVSAETVRAYASDRGPIRATCATAVASLYESLSMTLPPERNMPERSRAARARNRAARQGWVPPLAWDDIDDPNEQPKVDAKDRTQVDEVAVRRRMNGDRTVKLNRAETIALVRAWEKTDQSRNQCQVVTGIDLFRVLRGVG